ncbi:hypothetical protein ACQPVP_03285 [Clostridium nigeriense]|uniref:hypothetical protein n=1 Tax=Clostridium nigeriense TaxID=1805470 RepID=UPI003D341976
MRINDILKESQSKEYKELKSIIKKNSKEKLSERDLKDLMSHSSYKRGKHGAIKQVRYSDV